MFIQTLINLCNIVCNDQPQAIHVLWDDLHVHMAFAILSEFECQDVPIPGWFSLLMWQVLNIVFELLLWSFIVANISDVFGIISYARPSIEILDHGSTEGKKRIIVTAC